MTDYRDVPLLILDVDGTIREGKEDALGRFVNGPDDVRVFPEAVARMRAWKAAGGRILCVSNQGGIALGYVTEAAVKAAMDETWQQADELPDLIRYCDCAPHAPRWCRKPRPGLVILGVDELERKYPGERYHPAAALLVGDRNEDHQLARNLDVEFRWASDWRDG